ncbi:MAG: hypothetical protein ACRDBG_08340 [Waterburya sp.]
MIKKQLEDRIIAILKSSQGKIELSIAPDLGGRILKSTDFKLPVRSIEINSNTNNFI